MFDKVEIKTPEIREWIKKFSESPTKSALEQIVSSINSMSKQLHSLPHPLRFLGEEIRSEEKVKYLGVTLDRRLT